MATALWSMGSSDKACLVAGLQREVLGHAGPAPGMCDTVDDDAQSAYNALLWDIIRHTMI